MISSNKYSDQLADWLKEIGYTHCFYIGGGNIMHLLESASHRFECVPFVHEVGAGIAADYFNESAPEGKKAFVLVTAGPALTNLVTAIARAWVDSRELLVIGGQAKVSDLSRGKYRQIGFQELDGVSVCNSITKKSVTIDKPITFKQLKEYCELSWSGRKGPVFLELCIDVSAMPSQKDEPRKLSDKSRVNSKHEASKKSIEVILKELKNSKRPLILLGAGVDRDIAKQYLPVLMKLGIPLAMTFNGADRVGIEYEYYSGRPNWYGARWANLINQQADLVIALGTRLGLLQVGYNWEEFVPNGKVIQVDIDKSELNKPFPKVDVSINEDANDILIKLTDKIVSENTKLEITEWQQLVKTIRTDLSIPDSANRAEDGYIELHRFIYRLFEQLKNDDQIVPCSSGGTYTGTMQVMLNKTGQKIITSSGLAGMGFGLSGAIGVGLADKNKRTILLEGDGGFAQNLQELGTLKATNLNLKTFIFDNRGYASIRTTQKTYFNNHYVGCDEETGLGLPNWKLLVDAYSIASYEVTPETAFDSKFMELLNSDKASVFVVKLDPDQLYFPKLGSRINPSGVMESSPIHLMDPQLNEADSKKYIRYI